MKLLILVLCITNISQVFSDSNIYKLFDKINKNFVKFNSIAAKIAWESSLKPNDPELQVSTANYQKKWLVWQQTTCGQLAVLENRQLLNETQRRQTYLLCRGPKFTYKEARARTSIYDELQFLYSNNKICIPTHQTVSKNNLEEIEVTILNYLSTVKQVADRVSVASKMAVKNGVNDGLCLNGEDDFEKLMKNLKNEEVLRWLWLVWREKIGEPMKEPYRKLVNLENNAAWRKGYSDIGASWRDELEIPDLRQKCRRLYSEIKPLYTLLHGIVRFYLRRQYGEVVPKTGPIPAHLLGNLWSQNWEKLADLITSTNIDLDGSIKKLNWTVEHMAKRVEDFYQSLGLPPMTDTFWRESVFQKKNGDMQCHGSAADMFEYGDFRLIYCSGTSMEDFYVLHHEFGHIQYYMAYDAQPGLFRQANAAFHESIGDAIMYGVMTPQHLHRLGLVNDSILYVNSSGTFEKRAETKHLNGEDEYTDDEMLKTNDKLKSVKIVIPKTKHDLNSEETYKFVITPLKTKEGVFKMPDVKTRHYLNLEYVSTDLDDEALKTNDNFIEDQQRNEKRKDDRFSDEIRLFENIEKSNVAPENGDESEVETDDIELENDFTSDEILLLKQALSKIPQIPFALVIDEYRWKYFEGDIDNDSLNKEFWDLSLELQGIAPPEERSEDYFDVGAKFHVPDNTPYIRYFLSSFIQHQIFEALCRAAVFGRRDVNAHIPDTISLNRCDIYGSKAAGRLLKDFMSRGHSQHWQEILLSTTGNTDISTAALKRYYRPLYDVLARIVEKNNIPLGW